MKLIAKVFLSFVGVFGLNAAEPSLTFGNDIAPIVYRRCAPCHRPGEAAPFSFFDYPSVAKRAKQIAELTASRFMPPWQAEPGHGEFANSRRLPDEELAKIQDWVKAGAPEGNPADAPPAPNWGDGWELGPPDLIVKAANAYVLPPEGKDIYRNLVLPIPLTTRRFVNAVEFRPGNPKVVHHASLFIDQSGQSRRLAQRGGGGGFDGMELPESAGVIAGQMLGWEPGKRPERADDGLSWPLEAGSDLVVQLHLHPSGKPEEVQPLVGFYFTDKPPTNLPFLLRVVQWQIDIPPGAKDYSAENTYLLPVDVDVLRISPHAHYLGKELQAYALLPDGRKESLLRIPDWDFNWQGDFRYAKPLSLPRGTRIVLHFTFDNSEDNPRNPNHPVRRVRFGPQTTDEMAQITLQVLARTPEERRALVSDQLKFLTLHAIAYNEAILKSEPSRADAHAKLGQALLPFGRFSEAANHLQTAVQLDPKNDKPFYDLGTLFLMANRLPQAREAFENVLRLNPLDYQAHGNLGAIYLREGNVERAKFHLNQALKLNPADQAARQALESIPPTAN